MRRALPTSIVSERVIPVARGVTRRTAADLVSALVAGGLTTLEITVEGDGGFDAIRSVADGPATIGAGTVTGVEKAERAVEAGAAFLVSPHFDEELTRWALDNGEALIPGALSPSEVAIAWRSGAPAVKLFPASLGGPSYVGALLAPYPDLALVPTGGVNVDNARSYLEAGAVAVGVGEWLTGGLEPEEVTERAALLVAEVV